MTGEPDDDTADDDAADEPGTDATGGGLATPEHVADRAALLPEERRAGSDDPRAQAEAILADAEGRAAEREADPSSAGEHRSSEEATDP